MSCLVCCFKCLACLGCRKKLVLKYAFFPPSPPGYKILKNENEAEAIGKPYTIKFYDEEGRDKELPEIEGLKYNAHIYTKGNGKPGCGLLVQYTKKLSEYVIIFSHGNSTDIGRMIESLLDLAYNLKINVFCFEYSGFGQFINQDKCSDEVLIDDICEAYKYVTAKLKFPWHKVILYGQSVGSGPCVFLASNKNLPVAGLILHSPISSGLRILKIDLKTTPPNDFFPNVDLIDFSRCPIFIIHGDEDEDVSIQHAKLLIEKCHNLYEGWWAKKAGHNNVDIVERKEYFKKCFLFIDSIKTAQADKSEQQMLLANQATDWDKNFKHFYRKFLIKPEEDQLNSSSSKNLLIESMSVKSNQMNENLISGKGRSSIKEEEKKSSQNSPRPMKSENSKGKTSRAESSVKVREVEFSSRKSSAMESKSALNENLMKNGMNDDSENKK